MNLKDAVAYQDDAVVSKEILKSGGGTVTVFAFDRGQGLSEHVSPFRVLVHILDGEAQININNTFYTLMEGQSIELPADQPHAVKAEQQFKMLLIMLK